MATPDELFNVRLMGDTAVVRPLTAMINFDVVPDLRGYIEDVLRQSEKKHLLLDLEDVEFVDSLGIGMLAVLANSARKRGGRLRLAAVRSIVMAALSAALVDTLMDVYDTVAEAVGSDYPVTE